MRHRWVNIRKMNWSDTRKDKQGPWLWSHIQFLIHVRICIVKKIHILIFVTVFGSQTNSFNFKLLGLSNGVQECYIISFTRVLCSSMRLRANFLTKKIDPMKTVDLCVLWIIQSNRTLFLEKMLLFIFFTDKSPPSLMWGGGQYLKMWTNNSKLSACQDTTRGKWEKQHVNPSLSTFRLPYPVCFTQCQAHSF